jgi:hypothetical protein
MHREFDLRGCAVDPDAPPPEARPCSGLLGWTNLKHASARTGKVGENSMAMCEAGAFENGQSEP